MQMCPVRIGYSVPHLLHKGEPEMKVNPRTVKIILDFIAALAAAAAGVVAADFLEEPMLPPSQER